MFLRRLLLIFMSQQQNIKVDNHSIYNRTSTTSSHRHRDHHHLLSSDSEAEHVSLLMTGESNKASLSLG